MNRSGALTMAAVTGSIAFTRTTMEDGVLVALAALAASLVVIAVGAALINRSPRLSRAMRGGRRLEHAVLVFNEWLMALVGPAFAVLGAVLVIAGIWTGAVSLIIGIWVAWSGWSGIVERHRRRSRSRLW